MRPPPRGGSGGWSDGNDAIWARWPVPRVAMIGGRQSALASPIDRVLFFFTLGRGQNIISFRMVNFNFHHFLVVKFYFGSSSKYDRIGGDFMEFCSNFGGRRKSDPHAAKPGKRQGGTKRWPGVAPPHGAKVGQCQPSRCRPLPRRPMGPASRSTACEAVTISMPRRMALTC